MSPLARFTQRFPTMKTTHSTERVDGAYELTVNGDYFGRFMSTAAADRFRKLVTSGKPLDARTVALIAQARVERAERLNRAAVAALVAAA